MQLDDRIVGQGEVSRLMKLGLAHQQGARWGGGIAHRAAYEFPPPEPGGVEPHDGQARDRRAEWCSGRGGKSIGNVEEARDVLVTKNIGGARRVVGWKEAQVGDEAVGGATVSIQAEVAYDPPMATTDPGHQVLFGLTPGGKRLGGEISGPRLGSPAIARAEEAVCALNTLAQCLGQRHRIRDQRLSQATGSHGGPSCAWEAGAVWGNAKATWRTSSMSRRRDTQGLSALRWPSRAPIVLRAGPWRSRWRAEEWRRPWPPVAGRVKPLRVYQAAKASLIAVDFSGPMGARTRRTSWREAICGRPSRRECTTASPAAAVNGNTSG